jgi:hypothetical protein
VNGPIIPVRPGGRAAASLVPGAAARQTAGRATVEPHSGAPATGQRSIAEAWPRSRHALNYAHRMRSRSPRSSPAGGSPDAARTHRIIVLARAAASIRIATGSPSAL